MNKAHLARARGYSLFFAIGISTIASALIGACGTLPNTAGAPSTARPAATATAVTTANSSAARQYHEQIHISGRIHVLYQKDDQEQSLPGNFEWQQDQHGTSITLLSPLGQTIANIRQDAGGASLQQANQPLRRSENLDSLLNESLGWPLPVSGLRDWLQGYARQPDGSQQLIAAVDNQQLSADGWQLRYVSWSDEGGQLHPKRIDLQRYTSEAGQLAMRIVIVQWGAP